MTSADWKDPAVGGDDDAWIHDRERKLDRIRRQSERLWDVYLELKTRKALRHPSVSVLRSVPASAEWYLALAGFSNKTLANLRSRARLHGLRLAPMTVVTRLRRNPALVVDGDLEAFSKWLETEIQASIPAEPKSDELFLVRVSMIVGARIVGQGQNIGGQLAVQQLKLVLVRDFPPANSWLYEVEAEWRTLAEEDDEALPANRWKHALTGAVFDFTAGGNRPDLLIFPPGSTSPTLVAEIKGRKDISNVWESWMPQLADHLLTWHTSFPNARHGVLMTLVNQEMIDGRSKTGTSRQGLKSLQAAGLLDFVFNISSLASQPDLEFVRLFGEAMMPSISAKEP